MFVVTLFQSNFRMAKIGPLIQRFAQQELRNSNAIFSLGLYLVGITYLIYLLGVKMHLTLRGIHCCGS